MTEEAMKLPWHQTVGGYRYFDVLSAFQKSIRRGDEDEALFWGTELALTGNVHEAKYTALWNTMQIIASEDVGVADQDLFAHIWLLRHLWEGLPRTGNSHQRRMSIGKLYIVHAILLLVYSKKSRAVDHAGIAYFEGPRPQRAIEAFGGDRNRLMPSYAKGGAHAKGMKHFFEEGALLVNESTDVRDLWRDTAMRIRMERAGEV